MNRRQIFTVLILLAVIMPLTVAAIGHPTSGIVPAECRGENTATTCTPCQIFVLIGNLVRFILWALITPATVVALLIGGVLLVTAGGSEEKVKRAKSILWNTVLGFIIAFGAWLIINTMLHAIIDPSVLPKHLLETPRCELKGDKPLIPPPLPTI